MAMLQRQTYINDILNRLSGLASSVKLHGLLNLLDLHVISEDFYVGLLNLIYGGNFAMQIVCNKMHQELIWLMIPIVYWYK